MRTHPILHAVAILTAATFCLGSAPAPKPAPVTTTAIAAASSPAAANDPKGACRAFFNALCAGDEKAVFESIVLANDDANKEAHAVLGEQLAQKKWDDALAAAFKTECLPPVKRGLPDEVAKALDAATVTITGDTAQVVLGPQDTYFFARDKGVWKLDFAKTQRANQQGPYDKDWVAATAARVQIETEMIASVKAGKFASASDAKAELAKRLALFLGKMPAGDQAKRQATIADLQNIKTALAIFEVDNGRFPITEEGLAALFTAPPDLTQSWRGPYLEKMPLDAWGHAYIYLMPGTDDLTSYDLSSVGSDGVAGTADDIFKSTEE